MKKVLNCLKQNKKKSLSLKIVAISIFIILIAITFLTKYYGSTDIGDYKDVAKYFAGDFAAKIRSSHSYIYGLMLSPFVAIMHNFLIFKMTSLIFLSLIMSHGTSSRPLHTSREVSTAKEAPLSLLK